MATMASDKFIGYLISIESRNLFYQGVISSIDFSNGSIQLKNCYQNGLHCGNKLIDIKTNDIENVEILADPQNAPSILKPKAPATTVNDKSYSSQIDSAGNSAKSSSSSSNSSSSSDTIDEGYSRPSKSSKKSLKSLDFSNTGSPRNGKNTTSQHLRPVANGSGESGFKRSKSNGTNLSPPLNQKSKNINNSHSSSLLMSSSKRPKSRRDQLNGHRNDDENCFNSLTSDILRDEFDFEKNLALFDKNAFYEQVEGHSKPVNNLSSPHQEENAYDLVIKQLNQANISHANNAAFNTPASNQQQQIYRPITIENLFASSAAPPKVDTKALSDSESKKPAPTSSRSSASSTSESSSSAASSNKNYRFDEMVLDTGEPIDLQQIQVPCKHVSQTYVTDDGFIVPCIDLRLRQLLFDAAYRYGFSKQRQVESMGRCCAEMALQLVGGPLRFSPKNNHQKPSLLIVATRNQIQGACALYTARLLSTRNTKIAVYVVDTADSAAQDAETVKCFETELDLVTSSDAKNVRLIKRISELNTTAVYDLIISGGSLSHSNAQQASELVKSIEQCKASVLAIDPSESSAVSSFGSQLPSKWCILPVLPLAMPRSCGRVYLCDLGFTKQIFDSVDIRYDQSPFGAKFLIPLHND